MPGDPMMLLVVAFGLPVLLGVVAAAVLGFAVWRDPGRPTTPDWGDGDLAAMPPGAVHGQAGGLHRWYGRLAHEAISRHAGHVPRHGLDGAPPSIVAGLAWMTPLERARELTRQLGNAGYRPAAAVPRWARHCQLLMVRRLREMGQPARWFGPAVGVLP